MTTVTAEHLLKLRHILEDKIEEVSKLEGPQGPEGVSGIGQKGSQGDRGPQGLRGKDGKDGKDGRDGRDCACQLADEIVDLKVNDPTSTNQTRSYGVQGTSELRARIETLENTPSAFDIRKADATGLAYITTDKTWQEVKAVDAADLDLSAAGDMCFIELQVVARRTDGIGYAHVVDMSTVYFRDGLMGLVDVPSTLYEAETAKVQHRLRIDPDGLTIRLEVRGMNGETWAWTINGGHTPL